MSAMKEHWVVIPPKGDFIVFRLEYGELILKSKSKKSWENDYESDVAHKIRVPG